ncbi:hypothetical protein SSBR45G_12000 [Bradyrhizobium sp. SSBR45G]|uniref:hypothetical protein n=1 Tax=unclassified Bradyrhizobium TaxID=2631580 RepID=UPI002342AF65|nr:MULTISPECIES: hypothetical protein [unclassified Bradyrhizobium]GLH76292.1 hypothetical protein SSBR45G_12000 [Bradyrhizobium sp. SSBR45G]GLH83225.1 hypothetical protein SSBR45R_06850 [Bradyrhizobium sp. SSBR45R]
MDAMPISTGPPEHPLLDFKTLLRQGLSELERIAGDQWTDFNAHDPGITLLEAMCYALSDLGYRTFHPIPDLLAEAGSDTANGLFTPAQALTCRAVTPDDLRRVVLDVPGVKNAWIVGADGTSPPLRYDPAAKTITIDRDPTPPANSEAVVPRGLWRVLVEKSDLQDIDASVVRLAVAQRLYANRPLCEDFDDIVMLDPMPVAVRASVEIGETENGADVLLGIFERVSALISPSVGFLRLDQALGRGARSDEIFEGPPLLRGFVDATTLPGAERRVALHTSDVIRAIMSVPGVRAVRWILLARAGSASGEPWSLTLDETGAARLDLTASQIELVKDRQPVIVDTGRVIGAFGTRARTAQLFPSLGAADRDLIPSAGQKRDVAHYLPLETDLPRLYGVGAGALPDSADEARKAEANQLRGYLTVLDQLLANEFAQLGYVASLLSIDETSPRSYAAQLVGDDPDRDPIIDAGFGLDDLAELVEPAQPPSAMQRRNRLLNHLLGRFAETVTDDPSLPGTAAPLDADSATARLLQAKREFLRRMPELGSARGTGVDLLAPGSSPALIDRVRLRLGWPAEAGNRFLLVEHILLRVLPQDEVNALPLLAAAPRNDPWTAQLTFVFPARFRELETMIQRIMREETPAHLTAYLLWLDPAPFAAFAATYDDLLLALQQHRLADRLGGKAGTPAPSP